MGFDFDNFRETFHPESFGLGILAGWATGYAVYRARHALSSAREAVSQQASSAQEFASRSADSRYVGDLIKFCQTSHLAGAAINLSEILVEPQFVPAPELLQPPDEDVVRSVFHVVPIVPDYPYLHAPYNIPALAINELDTGDSAIALLGLPGSGRTTALQAIALWALGEVRFEPPTDPVEQRLQDEEAASESDEERAQQVHTRRQMEEMALETLARRRGIEVEDMSAGGISAGGRRLKQLTPVYAHFGNIRIERREFGRKIDPAEPLLRAVQHHTSGITRRTLATNFYTRLSEGKILLLLDGFDEIPADEQPRLLNWLEAYLDQYADNFAIVTGPARGYGGLLRTGLAPVFLRPWNDVNTDTHANLWAEHWAQISGKRRRRAELDVETLTLAKAGNRARTPFDLVAKLWATYDAQDTTDYETRMNNLVTAYLPKGDLETLMPRLIAAAQLQLDEGFVTAVGLEQTLAGQTLPVVEGVEEVKEEEPAEIPTVGEVEAETEDFAEFDAVDEEELDDYDELFGEAEDDLEADADLDEEIEYLLGDDDDANDQEAEAAADTTTEDEEKPRKSTKEYARLIEKLQESGLLVAYRGGRYQFRHPLIAAYLASQTFKEADEAAMIEKAADPAWQDALAYTAIHTPVDAVVEARMQAPLDVLQNTLLDTAHWLAYCSEKPQWRAGLLRELGNTFVAPNQFLMTRERIAAALVGSRDRNALIIFTKSLRHPNPDVRRLACLGVGALRDESSIETMTSRLVDPDSDVQLAAGLALGAIGTEAALDEMWVTLTEGTEELRQAVAEAFAAIPDEGYPILFDAAHAEDYMLRRAAVFGLRRINKVWALVAVYRRSIEDDQWYVRSAAESVFEEMQTGDTSKGVRHYPPVETIPWLRDWVVHLGQEAGAAAGGDSGDLLRKALVEGGPEIQLLSAANMGQLGMATHTGLLYTSLRNREPQVREAAYRALGDIQLHVGQPLPSPV